MAVQFPIAVKAVTVDLDGTLLDTIPDLACAANMMLLKLGRPELDPSVIRTFVGKGIEVLVQRTLAASFDGVDHAETARRGLALFEGCYSEVNGRHTTIYAGVQPGLDRLREQGIPLACVTNKSARYTLPLLDMLGLARYFEQVVAGDSLARKKPHPDQLLHAAAKFGIAPGDMLMVGDSLNDAQAARAAGCPVVCVTYGYNEGHDVRDIDADALVDTLDEAAALVRKA